MNDDEQPLSDEPEARYAAYAAIVEADDYEPGTPTRSTGEPAPDVAAFLAELIPAEEVARVRAGRPSLSGHGRSPARQVRLPAQLDAALVARAAAEERRPSDILRDALSEYLAS